MTAPVERDTDGGLQTGLPRELFEARSNDYDPAPDGERFLFIESVEDRSGPPATVVLDWPALLED